MSVLSFTLKQLTYFDAVAGTGSITAAAARCRVSASALALAVADLEASLGVKLIVARKGKGATLSPAGRELLAQSRAVLAQAEMLRDVAGETITSVTGEVSLGCYTTIAPFILPKLFDYFRQNHPDTQLRIREGSELDLFERLVEGRLDTVISYGTAITEPLAFDPIHEMQPYAFVAADHPLTRKKLTTLADLAALPQITFDAHPSRMNTERLFASQGLAIKSTFVTTNFELCRCLVAQGLGVAILFQRPVSSMTYDGGTVAALKISGDLPTTQIGLVRLAGAPKTARYAALRTAVAIQGDTVASDDRRTKEQQTH